MSPRAYRPALDSARFGRTPVLFLLGLAACCLIAIFALVLVVVQRGTAPTLVGLLLALLPIPLLVALILYLDRLEPEPRALLAAIFGAGAGIAVITALLGRGLHTGMITTPDLEPHVSVAVAVSAGAATGGAVVAETLNGLVLLALLASRRTEIDGVEDGVVYGSMVGLGFALVANVYAYSAAWNSGAGALAEEFARRGIFGPVFQATYVILFAALVAIVVVVIADRRRVILLITSFLPDFEDPEVVTIQDIRMLTSLRMRRLGRHWARLNLGIAGKQAMTQYQLAATELAMACRRKSLGQTTEEAYVRHRDDSLILMRAAAEIVRGQEQLYPPPWIAPDSPSVFVTYRAGPPKPKWPAST
jgi:RsiW-degrading membrane proteinase PrsW (M82 family)